MSISINQIRKINFSLQCYLVDQSFLSDFQAEFHYDFLYQIHYIRGIKNQNQKKHYSQILQQQTNSLLNFFGKKKVSFKRLQTSKKVGDTVAVLREVICRNAKANKQFLQQRKEVLTNLKSQNGSMKDDQKLNAFRDFYDIVLQGNLIRSKKTMKTVLTGIRKLFKIQVTKKKDKRERRKEKDLLKHRRMLYQTNRIIRDILDHCQILNRSYDNDPQFSNSINELLKDRRWMGPNLFKILLKHKWKGYQIDTLIDLMNFALKQQKFGDQKTQNMVKRAIVNMKICSTFVKDHPNATNSVRFIATVSNWGSNHIFSIQDLQNQMMIATNLQGKQQKNHIMREIDECLHNKESLREKFPFSSEISIDF